MSTCKSCPSRYSTSLGVKRRSLLLISIAKAEELVGLGDEPDEGSPGDGVDQFLEGRLASIQKGGEKRHLVVCKASGRCQVQESISAGSVDRSVGAHDLSEDQTRVAWCQIDKNDVGKVLLCLDGKTDSLSELIIASDNLVGAFA